MKDKGFTLLEILIVLSIIAIMSSVVVLSIGAPTYSSFIANARKIASTLSILSDEAVYTNSVIVCDVDKSGLYCQAYKNGEWRDVNINNIVSWTWPKNFTVEQVYINGAPLKQGEKIKFFANGDQQPTSLQVTDGRYHTWIDGNLDGIFQVNN
ncbi:MAG: Tfp pilus assembly protein FimT/FimU [Neisseriaceae bacterium]|jgi:type II secretion system protein H